MGYASGASSMFPAMMRSKSGVEEVAVSSTGAVRSQAEAAGAEYETEHEELEEVDSESTEDEAQIAKPRGDLERTQGENEMKGQHGKGHAEEGKGGKGHEGTAPRPPPRPTPSPIPRPTPTTPNEMIVQHGKGKGETEEESTAPQHGKGKEETEEESTVKEGKGGKGYTGKGKGETEEEKKESQMTVNAWLGRFDSDACTALSLGQQDVVQKMKEGLCNGSSTMEAIRQCARSCPTMSYCCLGSTSCEISQYHLTGYGGGNITRRRRTAAEDQLGRAARKICQKIQEISQDYWKNPEKFGDRDYYYYYWYVYGDDYEKYVMDWEVKTGKH